MEFMKLKRDGVQIPANIRKEMGISEGDFLLIYREGNKLILLKADEMPAAEILEK